MKRKIGLFEVSIILFFYFLPLISIIADMFIFKETKLPQVVLKWCVFYGVGLRLLTCGMKQALNPGFTAKSIFAVTDEKAFSIVRELGFANICSGLIGTSSLFIPSFRYAAAILGGSYFLLALIQHLVRKNKNSTERFVTVTDFSIVLEICIPLLIVLI